MAINKKAMEEFEALNMDVPPQHLGAELLGAPFAAYTSGSRLTMLGAQQPQFVIMKHNQFPRTYGGWENIIGDPKYSFDKSNDRPSDMIVSAVIPKHRIGPNMVKRNHSYLIIGVSTDDNLIHVFEMNEYPDAENHKFCYTNTFPRGVPEVDSLVLSDEVLSKSSAWGDVGYGMGRNAEMAYLTVGEVAEDALLISDELQEKAAYSVIKNHTFKIDVGDIPLNLYGDASEYKCMPDVGERVRDDGIVLAVRRDKANKDICDLTADALDHIQIHDDRFLAEPNATIVDVEVHIQNHMVSGGVDPMFEQFEKYRTMQHVRHSDILKTMEELVAGGRVLSPAADMVMFDSLKMVKERSVGSKLKLVKKAEPLNYWYVTVTIKTDYKLNLGSKLTGRQGEKGVVGAIWPKKNMPRNAEGVHLDIVWSPRSPFNRMNTGQFIEQAINGCARHIQTRARNHELGGIDDMYSYFIGFLKDIVPAYGNMVYDKTNHARDAFVEDVLRDGFYIHIPPFHKEHLDECYDMLRDKYGYSKSKLTYTVNINGKDKTVVTDNEVYVGSKYIYLMDSIPDKHINAVSVDYVSQFNNPVRSKSKRTKYMSLIGKTPLRMGEDEVSIMNMSVGAEVSNRLQCLQSASPNGIEKLSEALLTTDYPSNIEKIDITNEELVNNNANIGIARHMMALSGIEHVKVEN